MYSRLWLHFWMILLGGFFLLGTYTYEHMNQKGMPQDSEEWKNVLTPEQYKVLREGETEAPFTGKYTYSEEDGMFRCAACGNELFSSDNKFESGTGWPSFDRPAHEGSILTEVDDTLGMKRIEVKCAKCKSHLGHVFDDGPTETGKRYCINSVCLDLQA